MGSRTIRVMGSITLVAALISGLFILIDRARGDDSPWTLDACRSMVQISFQFGDNTSEPKFSCQDWPSKGGMIIKATFSCGTNKILAEVSTAADTDPSYIKGVYVAANTPCGVEPEDPPSITQCGGFTFTITLPKKYLTCHSPVG